MLTDSVAGVAGIVLAGGQSSRMGQNKALLDYEGKPLIEHMMALLRKAGCVEIHISGEVKGYAGIPDAVRHDGPARAMVDLLGRFKGRHERLLFVPVDMPLIEVSALKEMMSWNGSVFYKNYPLPSCLSTRVTFSNCNSVRDVLASADAQSLDLPPEWEGGMANVNTKNEWEAITS